MFEFAFPFAFFALPLPIVIFLFVPAYKSSGAAVKVPFISKLVAVTGNPLRTGDELLQKKIIAKMTFVICWVLIVISMANPIQRLDPIIQKKSGRDLLLVVDLSGSMETKDFFVEEDNTLSRLDAVKNVISDFIEVRSNDRIGLIIFGNRAFPISPFTLDHAVLINLMKDLKPGMAGPKTMIGDGIGLALKMFETSNSQNKVAILLTDGNDSGSKMPTSKAFSIAAQNKITIHTIAMGNPKSAGEAALDLDRLKEISSLTTGTFHVALDQKELTAIYDKLDQLEPEKIETTSYRPTRSIFFFPLSLMIAVFVCFSLYNITRSMWGRRL